MDVLTLPGWIIAGTLVICSVASGVIPVAVVRRFLPRDIPQETLDVAAASAFRMGMLVSLILGLVLADAQGRYSDAKQGIRHEAASLAGLLIVLGRETDLPQAWDTARAVRLYIQRIVQDEWPLLAAGYPGTDTANALSDLYGSVLAHPTRTPEEQFARTNALKQLEAAADARTLRLVISNESTVPLVFWWVALVCVLAIGSCFIVFRPTALNIFFIGGYFATIGIVLYFILILSHPFAGPGRLDPAPFEALGDTLDRRLAEQS